MAPYYVSKSHGLYYLNGYQVVYAALWARLDLLGETRRNEILAELDRVGKVQV